MKPQAKAWVNAAKDDITVVEEIIGNSVLTHMVAFHCEQAVEKLLKACLENSGTRVPKTHNLEVLVDQVKKHYKFIFDYDIIIQLNDLYIDSRYPSDVGLLPSGKPTQENARVFYQYAKELMEMIEDALSA